VKDDCGHHHNEVPRTFKCKLSKSKDLRYGENSHQNVAFYVEKTPSEAGRHYPADAVCKVKSFCPSIIADTELALKSVLKKNFAELACVIRENMLLPAV